MNGKVPQVLQELHFDETPTPGSLNPVTSGGVAESVSQQASNLAPDYTKTTYPAKSYVMHDGKLYTNPNAIGTAEDWNPAHWTQTTVAEMTAGVGGYKDVTLEPILEAPYNIPVGNKETVTVSYIGASNTDAIQLQLADDCTDAVVLFPTKSPAEIAFNKLKITRQDIHDINLFGKNLVHSLSVNTTYKQDTLVSNIDAGSHYEVPADWSDVSIDQRVYKVSNDIKMATKSTDTGFLIEIKGDVAILHIR